MAKNADNARNKTSNVNRAMNADNDFENADNKTSNKADNKTSNRSENKADNKTSNKCNYQVNLIEKLHILK